MFSLEDLGLGLRKVPTRDGSTVFKIDTPFEIIEGAPLEVYVQLLEGQVRFFDDGLNLHTLLSVGVCFDDDAKWGSLQRLFSGSGVCLYPSGIIEMYSPRKRLIESFARFLLALTKLESWVVDDGLRPKKDKKAYVTRAALAFKSIYPSEEIVYDPKIKIPHHRIKFDLSVGEMYVDVPFVGSALNHVKKVGNLRHTLPNSRTMAIINDFGGKADKAVEERDWVGVFVPAMLLSSLEQKAISLKEPARLS